MFQKAFLFITMCLFTKVLVAQKDQLTLVVGTYTGKTSNGIYSFTFNQNTGQFLALNNSPKLTNPSFLAFNTSNQTLYSVKEMNNKGQVFAFNYVAKSGSITEKNSLSAEGDHPCHLAVHPNNRFLAVSNYTGGNLALFGLKSTGELLPNPLVLQHTGTGPNTSRQEKAHVHSATWSANGNYLFVADLGSDKIVSYTFEQGKLSPSDTLLTKPGAGPRHFAIHPSGKYAYANMELTNEICSYSLDKTKTNPKPKYTPFRI
jgi:6-phosphogluconolactonase